MRVLFVDDDSSFLEQAEIFLEDEDERLDIETAVSAGEGLELLDVDDFDAIVSDYQMSGMDGLEFLRTVREERDDYIPFIIFTGKGREEVAMEALNLGADRYLQKKGGPKSQYGVLADAVVQEVESWKAKEELRKSKREKSLILENTGEIIAYHDTDHNIQWANKAYQESTGKSLEEIQGQKCYHARGLDTLCRGCPVTKAIKNGESFEAELTPQNQEHWPQDQGSWLVKASPIKDNNGDVIGAVEVASDITERKEREKKLKRYERGVEASDDSIYMIDRDFKYVFTNREHLSRLVEDGKIPREVEDEVIGEKYGKIHQEEAKIVKKNVRKVIESGDPWTEEYEFSTKDRWSRRTYSPVKNTETGEVEGVVVVSREITERKEAEEELRKVSSVVTQSAEAIIRTDTDFRITYMSSAAEKMYGYSQKEVEGKTPGIFNAEPESEKVQEEIYDTVSSGKTYKNVLLNRRKDGSKFPCEVKISPIFADGEIVGFVSSQRDVTDRKEVEEELKETKEHYRAIVETSPEAIAVTDLEGNIIDCNQKAVEQQGFDSKDEVIGKNAFELISPEDRDIAEKNLEKTLEKGRVRNMKYTLIDSDGDKFPAELSTSVIRDSDGNPVSFMAITKDITERKEAEEREEFLHSLLRHDLRNKANVVRGYLEKVKDFDFPEEAEPYLEEALKTTVNERDLIEKVRNLRKLKEEEVGEVEIGRMLDQIFNKLEEKAGERGIELELDKVECKVRGGPLLEELFSNLIENSIVHSGCDKIWITGEKDDEGCIVSVIDDGKGLSDGKKEKIFNRGFKEGEESGFGLGLYLVKRIVDNYGGGIEVRDSEDGGARFDVHFQKA